MKALLYPAWDTLEVVDMPPPEPGPGEVMVRVAACGICGSELEAFRHHSPRRPPPLVMGHEFCGTIADLGGASGTSLKVGARVVANALVPCGKCNRCLAGRPHLCARRQIFGMNRPGAFAEYVNVPVSALLDWPATLPAEAACLAEPLGNGAHMVGLTRYLEPSTVLVIGAGPIGLLAMQAFSALTGATILAADLSPERLQAAQRCGAERVINPRSEDVVAIAREVTGGEGVDVVVDAVGLGLTKRQSLHAARPGGAAVWIGLTDNAMTVDSYDVTLPERTVHGTYAAKIEDMQTALDLLASGKIEYESWIERFPITRADEAFRRMLAAEGGDIKAIIQP